MSDIQRYEDEIFLKLLNKHGVKLNLGSVHNIKCQYGQLLHAFYEQQQDHQKAIEAKDKEIENLKGQYKTLDIGFDKSLQINATQTKEIESLKAEVERLRQKQSDDSCKLCNWTCQQCGVFVDECDVLDDETHKGCGGICL